MCRVSWSGSTGQGSQELTRTARARDAVNPQVGGSQSRYGPGVGKGNTSGLFVSRLTRREPKGHREGIRDLEGTCLSLTEGVRLGKDQVEELRGEQQHECPRSQRCWWEKGTGGDGCSLALLARLWGGSGWGPGWGCRGHLCGGAARGGLRATRFCRAAEPGAAGCAACRETE